ncbi:MULTISPECIES: protein kinase [unclassified Streptomyces]|uniref:serine/threonine-protein kinase n=1 Tax=unclassified Streptomyces TaxID=2593676 RepID=UPI00380797CE
MAESKVIQGRYRLLEPIGRGGMGEVWRARDESLGRQVAVKCLKPPAPHLDPEAARVLRERFRREARVAAGLQHRGVTVVHDFGESDGVLFLVMELLDGRDLGRLLDEAEHRPLPVADVLDIAEQVAAALDYTHRQGVVHRDLKPANIVRLTDGTVKICDFGIARLGEDPGAGASRLTTTGLALGTPHYMSPEQIGGTDVDQRSDLYSLGCVLYEIATGVPPFDLGDPWAILLGHRDTVPVPPREQRPDLPDYLDRVILELLAKQPDQRPPDARELERRISVGRTTPPYLPALAPEPPDAPPAPTGESGPGSPLPSWTRGMTPGHRAAGGRPVVPPPDTGVPLSDRWTRVDAHGTRPEPPAPGPAAARELTALTGRHESAVGLARDGRWSEAAEAHRTVGADRARLLGADHPDTLTSRHEAAAALVRTGRAAEALRVYRQVADARLRVLGPDHPETLATRQETAAALGRLGRHHDAHQLHTAVLAARERAAGPDHPDTLRCRHDLAVNLARLGRLEEAYRAAYETAVVRARVLGPLHADTLATRAEVAHVLRRSARWAEALETYGELAAIRERALGPDHPDTRAARADEARCRERLAEQERTAEPHPEETHPS